MLIQILLKSKTVIIVSITLIIQSCIYEFTPQAVKLENLLVIYGMITNENGPHEITILKTKAINTKVNQPVRGAKVSISDDKGNTVPLTEDSIGKYHTPETFAGKIGVKYKLSIELQEGKKYESDYVELLVVPDISELEAEKITKPATGTSPESSGYQFYISTKPGASEQKYYKWDVFEDWEYRLPYRTSAYWDGQVLTQIDPPIPHICYRHTQFNDIYISNTIDFQTNYITHYPLNFTPNSMKFQLKYGIYVRQYALSEFSYNFWHSAIENNLPDPLYSKQPYQLIGNIKCISNPDETVFGIFEASAVKSKGITAYLTPLEAGSDYGCHNDIVLTGVFTQDLLGLPPGWIADTGGNLVLLTNVRCVFCKFNGLGTGIRPDYFGENGLKNEK
jgi:Domain of unknown function (DUF4249)